MSDLERFRDVRRRLGLSHERMAEFLDVASDRTVRYWEDGKRDIPGPVKLLIDLVVYVPEAREYLRLNYLERREKSNAPEEDAANVGEGHRPDNGSL